MYAVSADLSPLFGDAGLWMVKQYQTVHCLPFHLTAENLILMRYNNFEFVHQQENEALVITRDNPKHACGKQVS
jgi:hypothetical protein